jgi:predicted metal-dependent hydrolase
VIGEPDALHRGPQPRPDEPHLPGLAPDDELPFRIEVVRSNKRTKSYAGRLVGGVLRVTVPSWMSTADEARAVAEMTGRFRRKMSTEAIDLRARMHQLHRSYGLPEAAEIRWSDEMTGRWASCTPATSTIRISTRIAGFPSWVVDYVLVHEMAHLLHAGHGADFWLAVSVYPKTERAIGYLIAKSGDDEGLD